MWDAVESTSGIQTAQKSSRLTRPTVRSYIVSKTDCHASTSARYKTKLRFTVFIVTRFIQNVHLTTWKVQMTLSLVSPSV